MKLSYAIIGLGSQAISDCLPEVALCQKSILKAVCDLDEKKAKYWGEKLKVKSYNNYNELIEKEKIDFIICILPHDVYPEVAYAAAKKGIHILKEKPYARNIVEALNLKNYCNKKNVFFKTVTKRRLDPYYQTAFSYLKKIGKPFCVKISYGLKIKEAVQGWRRERYRAGGGCILDMGYHMVDLINWFFGLPDTISANFSMKAKLNESYLVEDTSMITFNYASGLYGSLFLSRHLPYKEESILILGEKGSLKIDKNSIAHWDNDGNLLKTISREKIKNIFSYRIDDFSQLIRTKSAQNTNFEAAHFDNLAFIEACYHSRVINAFVNPYEILEKKQYQMKSLVKGKIS